MKRQTLAKLIEYEYGSRYITAEEVEWVLKLFDDNEQKTRKACDEAEGRASLLPYIAMLNWGEETGNKWDWNDIPLKFRQ
jgi:hypothetical protein